MHKSSQIVSGRSLRHYFFLTPAVIVILVEALVVAEARVPSLTWPVWFSLTLITVNLYAYCLAGWLATRQQSERSLLSTVLAGAALLVVEVIVRSVAVGLNQGSSENEFLIASIQETIPWTAGISSTWLIQVGIILQYLIFSPFYFGLSLLGGVAARRLSHSR